MGNSLNQLIEKRRSIRIFKNRNISVEKVKQCIYNATLAPNSSNLQLWEFYHIKDKNKLKKIKKNFCSLFKSKCSKNSFSNSSSSSEKRSLERKSKRKY